MQIRLVGIESKDAQNILLSQEFLEYVCFWNLRLCCGEIFPLDGFVYFVPMDRNMARRIDTHFYIAGADIENRNLNFVANNKAFIFFSRKN